MIHTIRITDSNEEIIRKKISIGDIIKFKGSVYAIIGFKSKNKISGYSLLNKKDLTFTIVEESIKDLLNSLIKNLDDSKKSQSAIKQ